MLKKISEEVVVSLFNVVGINSPYFNLIIAPYNLSSVLIGFHFIIIYSSSAVDTVNPPKVELTEAFPIPDPEALSIALL